MVKLNFDVKTHILKNGLEVITIKKNTQISSINIGIKVGALNESLEEKGISHYIEHMIFKGTKNRTFQKLNDELEALGGEYNAFTDYSQTVYSISCLEEELKNAIELLSDMLINSEFPEEEIDKERGVILAEIRSSKDNIEDIAVVGNVQVTTQVLQMLMQSGIDVSYFSYSGKYLGHTAAESSKNIFLRFEQYELYHDENRRLAFAKNIVWNKVQNQIDLIKNYRWSGEYDWKPDVEQMLYIREKLKGDITGNQILGIEGKCSNIYFGAFGKMFK